MFKKIPVKIRKWAHYRGELPQYQSIGASGFDVRAQIDTTLELKPGERAMIPTGLSFEIPLGYEIQARPRSGLAAKFGISMVNTPGTIDADYRGEVKVLLINHGQQTVLVEPQERCAQLVIAPVFQADFELVDELSSTERGAGGFGSTGRV